MTDSLHMPSRRITLARVIEHIANKRELWDRDFVRDLSAWLHERGRELRLPQIEQLGLTDVVCTFHMKKRVALVVTGRPVGSPFEITARVDEQDFPFVEVELATEPLSSAYEFCTLDFGLRGARVRLTLDAGAFQEGTTGTCVVISTMGGAAFVRVAVDPDGEVVTFAREVIDLTDR